MRRHLRLLGQLYRSDRCLRCSAVGEADRHGSAWRGWHRAGAGLRRVPVSPHGRDGLAERAPVSCRAARHYRRLSCPVPAAWAPWRRVEIPAAANGGGGAMSAMLRLAHVSRRFGGVVAVNHVLFELHAGEVVWLIRPNGAGKTTLVNLITGMHRLGGGEIWYGRERIDHLSPDRIARRGIARTFQVVQPFPHMTVLENVTGGALFSGGALTNPEAKDRAMGHLEFTGLCPLGQRPACP